VRIVVIRISYRKDGTRDLIPLEHSKVHRNLPFSIQIRRTHCSALESDLMSLAYKQGEVHPSHRNYRPISFIIVSADSKKYPQRMGLTVGSARGPDPQD